MILQTQKVMLHTIVTPQLSSGHDWLIVAQICNRCNWNGLRGTLILQHLGEGELWAKSCFE